jgi:hypothetical protein
VVTGVLILACLLPSREVVAEVEGAPSNRGDITGVWWLAQYRATLLPAGGGPIPLTPKGRALYDHNRAELKKEPTSDSAHARCLPPGLPRTLLAPYPFEIVQSQTQVAFLYEANRAYRIVLLGEQHADPESWDASYMGDGVGHWEQGVLVIDTNNFNAMTWLDDSGLPHSDQLHIIERLQLLAKGSELEELLTIEDSPIFTHPWSVRLLFNRHTEVQLQSDWVCGQRHRLPSATRDAVSYR